MYLPDIATTYHLNDTTMKNIYSLLEVNNIKASANVVVLYNAKKDSLEFITLFQRFYIPFALIERINNETLNSINIR